MARRSNGDGPVVLERRPEARSYSIEDLVHLVTDGHVRVPQFQRQVKWEVQDAAKLLDSIYRGYPVGTVLFWRREALAERLHYGSVTVDAPHSTEALWVVDGQQRIHTLVRVLAGRAVDSFALLFHLADETFTPAEKVPLEARSAYVPLTEVIDSERLFSWVLDVSLGPQARQVVVRLGKRLREYQVPAYVVTTADEDTVREIFARLNDTGRRLEWAEIFHALHGARGARPSSLGDVCQDLRELGFGEVEEDDLYRMMLAMLGREASKDPVPTLEQDEARALIQSVASAARAVVTFLRRDAAIPHIKLLPYSQPLVTLARFFHLHPEPHARNRKLLARWLWRGTTTGQLTGQTVSTRRTVTAIDEDEHASVQRLLRTLEKRAPPLELGRFSFQTARSKVETLALVSLGPRHLETGELLDVSREADLLLPPVPLFEPKSGGNTLANRLVQPKLSRDVMRVVALVDDPVILASHGIPPGAHEALQRGDQAEFVRARADRLQQVVAQFVLRRTELDASDRPPLEALVVSDED